MAATDGVDLSQVHRIPIPLPFAANAAINAYLIDAKPLTLIDTGIKGRVSIETMETKLAERGYKIEDIEQILVTHAHIDHYGAAAEIVRRSGAKVYAHPLERVHMESFPSGSNAYDACMVHYFAHWGVPEERLEYVRRGGEFLAQMREDVAVDGDIVDRQTIPIEGFELEAIHVPGHCQGHVTLLNRERGILFSADHLLPDISPVPMLALGTDPAKEKPKSIIQFLASLDKIDRFPIKIGCPSHGDWIDDARALTHSYRLHIERRSRKIRKMIENEAKTPFEIAEMYFPKAIQNELFLVMSEVIGHLELLEFRSLGRVDRASGVERWHIAHPGDP